jgi:hypothetical protein
MSVQTYDTTTLADDALIQGDPPPVEQLIVRVLGRAHQMAESSDDPAGSRLVLSVAHSFADELAVAHPEFDRRRFIHTITDGRS